MTTYTVLFELAPSGMFGLPEEGWTVLPATPGQFVGDAIHARTGIRAAYGALPVFRRAEEALSAALTICGLACEIQDNFLRVTVLAETHSAALSLTREAVGRFVANLTLTTGRYCGAQPLLIEGTDGDDRPAPRVVLLSQVTTYDVSDLALRVDEAATATALDDERLLVGTRYLQHALWLFLQKAAIRDPDDPNARMLLSSCFLNLYKAASSVAGDPSKDRDYQSRYRQLGFDLEFFTQRLEALRALRDDYDVAHYRLAPVDPEEMERVFARSVATASEVLHARRRVLLSATEDPPVRDRRNL